MCATDLCTALFSEIFLTKLSEILIVVVRQGVKYQRQRQRQFGDIYRTHLFGRPTIVVIGEENVRKILLSEGKIF